MLVPPPLLLFLPSFGFVCAITMKNGELEGRVRKASMKQGNHNSQARLGLAVPGSRWWRAASLIALESRTCGAHVCVSRLPSAWVSGVFLCQQSGKALVAKRAAAVRAFGA